MAVDFSDEDIASLVGERKSLPSDWRERLRLRAKRGHEERDLDCTGELGSEFRVILRQNILNTLDFSVILAVRVPQSNRLFRLRRYNGRSHEHTNRIEGDTFYGYHTMAITSTWPRSDTKRSGHARTPTPRSQIGTAILTARVSACFKTRLSMFLQKSS